MTSCMGALLLLEEVSYIVLRLARVILGLASFNNLSTPSCGEISLLFYFYFIHSKEKNHLHARN